MTVERRGQNVSVLGPEYDSWMGGLSAADVIRKFGVDPNVILTLDGLLTILEGNDLEVVSSHEIGFSSSHESVSETHENRWASVDDRERLKLKLTKQY